MLRVVISPTKLRDNVTVISGHMPLQYLLPNNFIVPVRHAEKKVGYQRVVERSRVNKLADDLRKNRTDLPTSLLLNIRGSNALALLMDEQNGVGTLQIDAIDSPGATATEHPFYVVDGQHRILALKEVFEEDTARWSKFTIPFICFLGATERQEMEQFYTVNSTAKSVKTDLALDLLKQRVESDSRTLDAAVERGEVWKVKAQSITEILDKECRVWRGTIRFPNAPKENTTISSNGFVSSLKRLLQSSYFQQLTDQQGADIIGCYWTAVQRVCPEPFEDDVGQFSLQKSVGVNACHHILLNVVEVIRSRGNSVFEVASYEEIIDRIFRDVEGDNARGDVVRGADFWRAGSGGAAGSFSSSTGQRVLINKLLNLVPQMDIN